MQLKSITLLAASLALAQASTWSDASAPADTTEVPSPPTGKPQRPTGGDSPVADDTTSPSMTWGDESTIASTSKTPVADTTTTTAPSSTWADMSSMVTSTSTPVADTSSDPSFWGDLTDVSDDTTTSSSVDPTWSDYNPSTSSTPDAATSTSTTMSWGDYDPSTSSTPDSATSTTVYWGDYSPPTGAPNGSQPPSGGQGQPPSGGQGQVPSSDQSPNGGQGQPPSGGQGQPPYGGQGSSPVDGDQCGVVTVTQTNTVYVTAGAAPTWPAAQSSAVATSTAEHTWADMSAAPSAAASSAPSQGGYMGIVEEWRSKLGLSDLQFDSQLQANAQKTADQSGGQLKHELNPGSMAQVLAPGQDNLESFYKCFVGGWLCEIPTLPGLDGVCASASQGWDYEGQTGHAKILTSPSYSKIGCANGDGIWSCDLA